MKNIGKTKNNIYSNIWVFIAAFGAFSIVSAPSLAGEYCKVVKEKPESSSPWCGGTKDVHNELSCTPFNYRPWSSEGGGGKDPTFCDSDEIKRMSGGPFNTTKAWMYFKDSQGTKDSSYWVFHGCDGAGIMPDCVGDQLYVERIYGRTNDQSTIWCQDGIKLSDIPQHAGDPTAPRRQCQFKHPGTGIVYENYEAGQWGWNYNQVPTVMLASNASGGWGSNVANIVRNQARDPFNGKDSIVMVTYPWVCTGVSPSPYDDQTGLFTNPKTPGAKCYWDNEPGKDRNNNTGWPPQLSVYWMQLNNDGKQDYLTVYGYYLDNTNGPSMKPMANGNSWRLYVCSNGECPW